MAASQYSNARAQARQANPRVNTTQRSWSNYAGDRPIKSNVGSSFYRNSELYGPVGGDSATPEAQMPPTGAVPSVEEKESKWEKLQRESALRKGMEAMRSQKPMVGSGYTGPVV